MAATLREYMNCLCLKVFNASFLIYFYYFII